MNNMLFDPFLKKLKKGQILSCLIMKNNQTIFSFHKNKKSEMNLHPINSCTKSVVSMLFGICLRDGLITDIHTPIAVYLDDYSDIFADSRKKQITLYHLLTMTPGLHWPEFGEWNFGTPMEYSKDIIRFVLEQELAEEPGAKMNYSSGCSNVLSYIIQEVTGMKLIEYANRVLFSKLGIKNIIWHEKQGINLGANGLKLRASDMMKLGWFYLQKGQIEGVQVVPVQWIEESTKPRFLTYENIGHYGYHWWTSSYRSQTGEETSYYMALGLFGQYIIVIPKYEMVLVNVSLNYSDTMIPLIYFRNYIMPIMDQL